MNAKGWQASCVAIAGRALLIEGEPGTGKTSLALMLVDRGARLIGDDAVLLDPRDGVLHAMPHPATHGLIEIRNVGIATMPVGQAPVALVLRLSADAPRLPDAPATVMRAGIALPLLELWPGCAALALRAEMALTMHGLPVGPAMGDSR